MLDSANSFTGRAGIFQITRYGPTNGALAVYYNVAGTASNGVDYTNNAGESLAGNVTIAAGQTSTNILIIPAHEDFGTNSGMTVSLSLMCTNSYLVNPAGSAATMFIYALYTPVAFGTTLDTQLPLPTGLDYDPVTNSLIVAVDSQNLPNSFFLLNSNTISSEGAVSNNWSDVDDLVGVPPPPAQPSDNEIQVAVVKNTTNGFTEGVMYYAADNSGNGVLGWVNTNAAIGNSNWVTLSETMVRGGLWVDQTGLFSNRLIAVTGGLNNFPGSGGVWSISASGTTNLLTHITNATGNMGLEGVITIPVTDTNLGPWAGKILTASEETSKFYTISTNNVVTGFLLTNLNVLVPEDFLIIPTNQDLYCVDVAEGDVVKVPSVIFSGHGGDLVIDQEDIPPASSSALFILHWNGASFVATQFLFTNGSFENMAFAPAGLLPEVFVPPDEQ